MGDCIFPCGGILGGFSGLFSHPLYDWPIPCISSPVGSGGIYGDIPICTQSLCSTPDPHISRRGYHRIGNLQGTAEPEPIIGLFWALQGYNLAYFGLCIPEPTAEPGIGLNWPILILYSSKNRGISVHFSFYPHNHSILPLGDRFPPRGDPRFPCILYIITLHVYII